MQPYLALITPLGSGGYPDQGLPPSGVGIWPSPGHPAHPIAPGGQPPGIWPSPGYPAHPIAPGGQPPGIWGGAPSYPDQGLPGQPPGIWPSPGYPSHPIAPGGQPPGIWPSPGHPAHPIAPGGRPPGIWGGGGMPVPTPPIYLPPGSLPGLKPEHPIYIPPSIWPSPGVPTHPIVLPPEGSGDKPEVLENWDVKTAWSPSSGWVVAIVPSEEHPGVPTPS
jgi:protein LSM14